MWGTSQSLTLCSQYIQPDGLEGVGKIHLVTLFANAKLKTFDLASGGATIDAALVPPYTPAVLYVQNPFVQSSASHAV